MQLIALTGGIASGKSTVGRHLAALGADLIDADELARDAVAPDTPGLERVFARFGDRVRAPGGALDRAALGAIVFRDPQALAGLNAIVHPEVRRLATERVQAAKARDPRAIVVYEIPLFVESGAAQDPPGPRWDLVVVADAPVETRVQRMVGLRGMEEEEARRRIASQASDAERRAVADVVIDTSGTEAETIAQVEALWQRLATG